MDVLRRNRAALGVAAWLAAMPWSAVHGDTVIHQRIEYAWKRGAQGETVEDQIYRLASTRARIDQGSEVYLVDTGAGTLHSLDLDEKHFYRYPSPTVLEAMVPKELLESVREQFARAMPRTVDVTRTGEVDRIGGYEAEHVWIEAGGPDEPLTARFDLWVSAELWRELAETAYWPLERDRLSTSPYTAWLVEPLADLHAFPVKTEVAMELRGGRMRTEYVRTLVAVERSSEVPDDAYRVPEGFTPFPQPVSGFVSPKQ